MCVVLSSVCATTVDNSGVYYLKGVESVWFRCPSKTVGFSGTRLYLCTYNQPSWATLRRSLPPGWVEAQEGYSLVVTCTRRRSICYPYSRHPLQAQAPLNLSVMACHSLEDTSGPFRNVMKHVLQNHYWKQIFEDSWATVALKWQKYGQINLVSTLCVTDAATTNG